MQPMTYTPGDIQSLNIDHVLVDGKRIQYVILADPHRGIVDAYAKDAKGNIKLHRRGKRPITKRYRGKVEVIFNGPS